MGNPGEVIRSTDSSIAADPTSTSSSGTASSGTTETRDAVLGDYTFTARAGRRYRVIYDGLIMSSSVAADVYQIRIRNGGASTPTAASTLIAASQWKAQTSGGPGQETVPVGLTFVPGAGTVTLSAFTVRSSGTGVGTPLGTRELYVLDIGPS